MSTPAKPAAFHPETPPPGFEKKLISFWQDRPIIVPRLQLVHTNGAAREGSVEASYNWANQQGSDHTIPHCQIDRSGRGALLLPSNRKGIGNGTITSSNDLWETLTAVQRADITAHGSAANFSLVFETADTGYLADATISAFTVAQAESVAVCLAYYAWGYGIPLTYPGAWHGSGTACHTEPFTYPYWTTQKGKICPGLKKKAQVRDVILPRARQILDAWLGVDDVVTDEDVERIAKRAAELVWQQMIPDQPSKTSWPAVNMLSNTHAEAYAAARKTVTGGGTVDVGAIAKAVANELHARLQA